MSVKNSEARNVYLRNYYLTHKEYIQSYGRKYVAANRRKINEQNRKRYKLKHNKEVENV
jgi:hypothetical protein